jgi:hypothetical protein
MGNKAHSVGQVWYLENDERYSIHLRHYQCYSVPMYCCHFCGGRVLAACRSLSKAYHACATLKAERNDLRDAPTVANC